MYVHRWEISITGLNILYAVPHFPAGPTSLPFIGALVQIAFAGKTGQLYEKYHNICKRYGKVMGARIGILNLGTFF